MTRHIDHFGGVPRTVGAAHRDNKGRLRSIHYQRDGATEDRLAADRDRPPRRPTGCESRVFPEGQTAATTLKLARSVCPHLRDSAAL